MKKQFTKTEMTTLKGCYSIETLNACSFMKLKQITIESILESEIPLIDKLWFVFASCDIELKDKLLLCFEISKIVLPIYNEQYPNDDRVTKCIQL